jgi:sugar phosphate isomerase/epimerase
MKIGLSTYFFPYDPVEIAIEKLAKTGVKYIEIIRGLPHFPPENTENYDLKRLKGLIGSYNLNISVHAPFFDLNLGSVYKEMRKFSVNQFKKCIEFCSEIGADLMVIHPGYSSLLKIKELYRKAEDEFVEALREVVDYGVLRGVKVALENMQSHYFFAYKLNSLLVLAENIENLGITLDIGHAFIMKQEEKRPRPEEEIAQEIRTGLRPFLNHVHIHDNRGKRDEHLGLGKGEINFSPIVKALKEIDFEGRIISEAWEKSEAEEQLEVVKAMFKGGGKS